MGAVPKTADVTPAPPQPETVRRADADAKKTRALGMAGASARSGVGASDMTKGALAMTGPVLMKQKLGGQ
jgi:hypothetical protein